MHVSVLPEESIHYLNCRPGGIYVDATLGGSGHSSAILKRIVPGGKLIGIDRDADAVRNGYEILEAEGADVRLVHGDFADIDEILDRYGIQGVDGIMCDLGISMDQIQQSGRGFGFDRDEPLDMRMNAGGGIKASDIIQNTDEKALSDLFQSYGEERFAKRIARKIVEAGKQSTISTSAQLTKIICDAIPGKARHNQGIHPATRVFMALRIAVNRELETLRNFLDKVPNVLNDGGRLVVISFHSLEDRIVKHWIKGQSAGCICPSGFPVCVCNHTPQMRIITRKAVRPAPKETAANPASRSAKLRAAEKC